MAMSGNPFRRKLQQDAAPDWPHESMFDAPDLGRRRSSVKRVRIQTPPPLSPDSIPEDDDAIIRRVSDEQHEGSPPPDPNRIDAAVVRAALTQDDPFGRPPDDEVTAMDQEVIENTRRNSATGSAAPVDVPIVKNPFQKTLATMQHGFNVANTSTPTAPEPRESDAKLGRASMDVDAFKRLLLTGNAEPSPAPSTTTGTSSSSGFGEESSTETSVSKRSLSGSYTEQDQPAHVDDDDTTTSSDDDSAGERPAITTPRAKPPPPKHRHGKLVGQQNVPQTVPFSYFSVTETSAESRQATPKALPPRPPQRHDSSGNLPLSSPAKLFPDRPTEGRISQERPIDSPGIVTSPLPLLQQAKAPPPPLARRSSQHRASTIAKAESSPTFPPSASQVGSGTASSTTSRATKAPPPPPARRTGAKSTSETFAPLPEQTDRLTSSRSSSMSSHHRPTFPPPAPPRRARGSSKSSMDNPHRTGMFSSSTRSSIDESTRSSMDASGIDHEPGNVLADMDALQAEIEALRAQARRTS